MILKVLSVKLGSCLFLSSPEYSNSLNFESPLFGFSSAPSVMNPCPRASLPALTAFLFLLATSSPAFPQGPGSLDTPFDTAVSGSVLATAVLPDGRMIIGGNFTTVGGVERANIARLDADGNVDPAFTAGTNGSVMSVAVQADGKLVLGGQFTSVTRPSMPVAAPVWAGRITSSGAWRCRRMASWCSVASSPA